LVKSWLIIKTTMDVHEPSQQQLQAEIAVLRRQVAQHEATQAAFAAQTELLTTLLIIGRTATAHLLLKTLLQQSLQIANRLTHAENGSLFLLNRDGVVVESILARGATIREEKDCLIGKVLQQGLAGWVGRHRQLAVIDDTQLDERWVKLPQEPYTARSVLCVPLLRGKSLLGLITLMHSQTKHFHPKSVHLMQAIADQMALVLDLTLMYLDTKDSIEHVYDLVSQYKSATPQLEPQLEKPQIQVATEVHLPKLGMYILMSEGKFLYVNHAIAEIFGYTFSELVALESFDRLVASNSRQKVVQHVNQCLQSHGGELSGRFWGQQKDGGLIRVEVYGAKTKFYGKSVIIGVLHRVDGS
jgi:PAS domain S-box-containing protein